MVKEKNNNRDTSSIFKKANIFFNSHRYAIVVFSILFVSFVIRFYHFDMRWGLGGDDSRDIVIAKEALLKRELPLTGSFSSAGPFVFGPFFYWYIMISYLLFPFVFTVPWIFTGLVGVLLVFVLMTCARKLAGDKFAFIVGLLSMVSPQLLARSLMLGQHTFVGILSATMILCFLFFIQKKKMILSLLIGFCIGSAINFHYQAINLLIFVFAVLFVPLQPFRFRFFAFFLTVLGVAIALSPLLFWDSQQHFASINNLFDYFLVGQYRLYVPNSWKLFLFTSLPSIWSFVLGGYMLIGLMTMILSAVVFFYLSVKKKLKNEWLFLLIPFILLLLLNRYYHGERSEGYLLYLMPLVLLISAYGIYALFQNGRYLLFRRITGISIFAVVLVGNLVMVPAILAYRNSVPVYEQMINTLQHKFPHQKFVIYDFHTSFETMTEALSALLLKHDLVSQQGIPIGVTCFSFKQCPVTDPTLVIGNGLKIVDLRGDIDLKNKKTWINKNPDYIYDDLIGWLNKHQLHSSFSLKEYIIQKIHGR